MQEQNASPINLMLLLVISYLVQLMLADNSIRFQPVKVQKIRYYVTNYSIICHKSTNFQCILSAQY